MMLLFLVALFAVSCSDCLDLAKGPELDQDGFRAYHAVRVNKLNIDYVDVLQANEITFPHEETYHLRDMPPTSDPSVINMDFVGVGDTNAEAILSVNTTRGTIFGRVSSASGNKVFIVAPLDSPVDHVWIEVDVDGMGVGLLNDTVQEATSGVVSSRALTSAEVLAALNRSLSDQETVAVISVKMYYTTELRATSPNLDAEIEEIIAITNQGYVNSDVKIELCLHSTEEYTCGELSNNIDMLLAFQAHKASIEEILGGAALALLLTEGPQFSGIAYVNTYTVPIGMANKLRALTTYTFAHEVGHILGLVHNAEVISEPPPNEHGVGYLVPATDKRTIMAYSFGASHLNRINYHSSETGTDNENDRTGTPIEDSVSVLNARRFIYEMIGDQCQGSTSTNDTAADVFLLVGGYVDGIISADVHTLDLSDSGSVCDKKLPDLPSPSYGVAGMTTEDGRPLVCGGYGTVPPVTKECHYYDAAADSWVLSSAETIVGRFLSASVQTSTGEWWIMGGRETKTVEVFSGGSFAYGPSMPEVVERQCAAVTKSGKILMAGGTHSNRAYEFDPSTGQWTRLPDMLLRRIWPACGVTPSPDGVGEDFVVAGRGKGLRRKWSTQIYNTDTGVWRLGPTVPSRFDYSRAVVVGDTFVVVAGIFSNHMYEYDWQNETWLQRDNLPNERFYHAVIPVKREMIGC